MSKHLTNYNDGWMGLIGQQGKKKDKAEELIQEVDENSRKGGDQG